MRRTKQRKVILEELQQSNDHPTAYEIYERARSKLPQISLGTVYRNLEILSANEIIKRLDMGQEQRRFDFITADHNHIRCISCGRIDDIPLNTGDTITTTISMILDNTDYSDVCCNIDFNGICPQCSNKDSTIVALREQKKAEINKHNK